jgi:hypothetical protein
MTKALLILLLLQHGVISAKSGLITFTDGRVNVRGREHIGEGNDLTTRTNGRAEFLLNPDSYMRIMGDTRLILESESLDRISVRLIRGAAVIDADDVDDDMPIRVATGRLEILVVDDGLYLFDEERIYVLDGKLRIDGTDTEIKKDWLLIPENGDPDGDGYDLVRFDDDPPHPLLRWNERRAAAISRSLTRPNRDRFPSLSPFD